MRVPMSWPVALAVLGGLAIATGGPALAVQIREEKSRFDHLIVEVPAGTVGVTTASLGSIPAASSLRAGWESFREANGRDWRVYLDRRSGAPMLVEGKGIRWIGTGEASVDALAASLRIFVSANKGLLLAEDLELVLDREASVAVTADLQQIVFARAVGGVPVAGERYVFHFIRGNLVSFGAPRWSRIDTSPIPVLGPADAQERMLAYMGVDGADTVTFLDKPKLEIIALGTEPGAPPTDPGPYAGPLGSGYRSALVWRVVARVEGEIGIWAAQIDAHDGKIRSFADDEKYAQVRGGVYPVSNDQQCPDGCVQPNYPMPYARITVGGNPQTANAMGVFNCTPGGASATTNFTGQYVHVNDICGTGTLAVTCDANVDFQSSTGTDCAVPPGTFAGNTHSARTGFYHLNRIAEHARTWLPNRPWLFQQLTSNVNINSTCNATWDGFAVNFRRSGGGCRNTGEIAGVFLHEWGHGLDQNDGGGFDNPSEAYADVTAIMSTHVSCVGRGFRSTNCTGYGDPCSNCTGLRDLDFAMHGSNAPVTPAGFVANLCPLGSAPCGRETHCEGYVGGQTMWDLATRDLPVMGLDTATAWQLADKLWYRSRNGSGGNAYNCSLPSSDGCSAISWFSRLRVADDDDGNLANGTPHGAAIFAAFNRHGIACGNAGDPSNQSTTICPPLATPVLSGTTGSASAALTWSAVAGATGYNVLRNDASCSAGSTIVATVPGTNFTDSGLVNGFTEYYRVQAKTANLACDSPVSNCLPVTPQPFAGAVKLDAGAYSCGATITVSVVDGNVPGASIPVTVASPTEPGGETVILNQAGPGSATYTGTIAVTTAAPAADGLLSIAHGDAITASYLDEDDGSGGTNVPRETAASADCAGPVITKVEATRVSFDSARITWKTDEPSTSVVHHGTTPPPAGTATAAGQVFDHVVDLSGLTECTTYLFSAGSTDGVGNVTTDNASGAYHTFVTGKNSALDFASIDTPIPIPDNSSTGATSTINVALAKTVLDVNVTVTINHTFVGDLTIALIAPNGVEIPLAVQRGGSGDNYTGTVFDDEAAGSITSGTPPFAATFRPEFALSALDGMNSAGAWRLKVQDNFQNDAGTLAGWTLTLTLPPTPCGPKAAYQSSAIVTDTCGGGGPGSANGRWDAGEQVNFKVNLANVGTVKLTGVSATITSSTPGVVMVDGNAAYPGLSIGIAADSIAPHFTALLPTSVPCGTPLQFQVTINAAEGSWPGSFSVPAGLALGATGTVLTESFTAGIPPTWTVGNGGTGGGLAQTWTAANPGVRVFTAPLESPVAIVDSDAAGVGATQDEELITPALSLASSPIVSVHFDQHFRWHALGQDEIADVDVRSSTTGGAWVNVFRQQGASSAVAERRAVDVSAQAGGATNVQVRFHNYGGSSEWWWELDNVRIDTAAYAGCEMPVCGAPQPNVARPVGDGIFGTGMRASRGNPAATSVVLNWDVATCASADHHVLYGDLANVASVAPTGSFCDLGASGLATWTGVPSGNLWFVVVGDNNATVEGTWGTDSGGHRGGATASGFCGAITRDNAATCP
jgi:subtilisin-like proprotein convertase family protein